MTTITFSENHDSLLMPFEDGMPLAAMGDPRHQALKWVYSLGKFPCDHVVVVGLGSGFHISALADLDPTVKITVVDSREALTPVFKSQFPELKDRVNIVIASSSEELQKSATYSEVITDRAFVVSFKDCWGAQAELFSEFFSLLAGRTVESVKFHLEQLGMDMKSQNLNFTSEKASMLTLLDVMPLVEKSDLDESKKQIFRTLSELVK